MSEAGEGREHIRIVAIIQARMGSTRLPGKVLKDVAGKPLLWHIIHRLKRSVLIEEIAIATTDNPIDNAIVAFGREHGVKVVRGPEDNVLARFARAAEALDADIIVRVSSDAPFLDAGFIDHLVASMIEQNGDYVLLEEGAETAHEGVDPFSRRALDKLMMDAGDDPTAREHVTGYFKLHPDFVHIARAKAYPQFARSAGRLTIDTPDDLAFVEAVHARLKAKAGEASLEDLLFLLEREPSLRAINAHVQQKGLRPSGGLALFRCDGGGQYGYGHVKRCIALGRALRDREGIASLFAINGTEDAAEEVRRAGFEAVRFERPEEYDVLATLIMVRKPDLFIADCRDGLDREKFADLADTVNVTAVIDDGSDRRLAADFAYYPPVPQVAELDWTGSHCTVRTGWQWALLGLSPGNPRQRLSSRPTLLVTMGGSDPTGLTLRAARALAKRAQDIRIRFVLGPGMANRTITARAIVGLREGFETVEGARGLTTEFASCDMALCAFGVTAYELASYGVPAIYLCLTEDHAKSASAFDAAGMGLNLGVAENISDEEIALAVERLFEDAHRRREMHRTGLMTIDGTAATRIAADLAHARHSHRGAFLQTA